MIGSKSEPTRHAPAIDGEIVRTSGSDFRATGAVSSKSLFRKRAFAASRRLKPAAQGRLEIGTGSGSPEAEERSLPAWVIPWFGLVIAAFSFLTLSEPTGWLGSDDAGYYAAAEYIASGETITRAHHHYSRLAVSLPIALSISIFGHHTWAVILPTFLCAVACLIVVALLGRVLWGWAEGLLAATLMLAIPYFTTLSTAAYPDVIACFWCTLSMYLALRSARTINSKTATILGILSGLMFAIALSSKILVAPMLAAVLYVACLDRSAPKWRLWTPGAAVLIGVGVGLVIESAIFAVVADDALFRWRSLLATHANTSPVATGSEKGILTGQVILDRLLMPARRGLSGWGWIGLTFWPVLLIAGLVNRKARPLALGARCSSPQAPQPWSWGPQDPGRPGRG